jgi:hypothetical protein
MSRPYLVLVLLLALAGAIGLTFWAPLGGVLVGAVIVLAIAGGK